MNNFSRPLTTFTNSLDSDQAQRNISIKLFDTLMDLLIFLIFFFEKLILINISAGDKKSMQKLPSI